jgi:membrane protease YdiL (CAAX protease family)
MNNEPSFQNPAQGVPVPGKLLEIPTNSAINRKRIFIFLAITFGLTLAPYLANFLTGESYSSVLEGQRLGVFLVALMFAPMLANIATRLITREGWSNTLLWASLRSGRWRYYLAAWFLPPAAAVVGGAFYYLLFPEHFDPSMAYFRQQGLTVFGNDLQPLGYFMTQLAVGIVQPIWVMTLLYSLGEEIGWRAYLLPKLMAIGPRKAALLVGIIQGVWHWPSILLVGSNYGFEYWGAPVSGPLLFVLSVTLTGVFDAWVTIRSGSVWPAAISHGAMNTWNTLVYIFCTADQSPLIGPGSQGVIGMLGYAGLALLVFFNPRTFAQPASATMDLTGFSNPPVAGQTSDQVTRGTIS